MLLRSLPLLFVLVAAPTAAQEVTGRVLGHDGSPMPLAHAHVYGPGQDAPATVQAGPDGRFTVAAQPGFVTLRLTGADHRPLERPLLLEPGDRLMLTARLAANPLAEPVAEVRVYGDFPGSGRALEPRPDGTFAGTFAAPADTLAYHVSRAFSHGRRVNGTAYDRLVYDGEGDYVAVLDAPDDSVTITFDPARVPRSDALPRVDFDAPTSRPARVAEVLRAMWNRSDAVQAARVEAFRANVEADEATRRAAMEAAIAPFELEAEAERIAAAIAAEANPAVRRVLLLDYLSLDLSEEARDAALVREALDAIGPAGPLWSAKPEVIAEALDLVALSDPAAAEDYAAEAFERHPDPEVRAYVALRDLEVAHAAGDTARAQERYALLQEPAYADSAPAFIASTVFDQYDTTGPVRLGAPVPAFELPLLGGGTVSNASLLGTTYLLDFWATWCVPCIAEMPVLHAAYERFRDRGFEIVSLSFDEAPEVVEDFRAERYPMPWRHVFVEGGFDHPVVEAFEVYALPMVVLVGPDGTVVATERDLRGEALAATLARVFGEGTE